MRINPVLTAMLTLSVGVSFNSYSATNNFIGQNDKQEVLNKIEHQNWAKKSYESMKDEVDSYLEKTVQEPDWVWSRLAMNWNTKYTTAVTEKEKYIKGEGKASVATPMFAGSRDWKTSYKAPAINDLKPYNDFDGQLYLEHKETGLQDLVSAKDSGHSIEIINRNIMALASKSSFIYWMNGDEKYAKFAADILWTYMNGFYHTTEPVVSDGAKNSKKIIGVTSFEVIHEDILKDVSISYSFLKQYMGKSKQYDNKVVEVGIKRFIDRIINGGDSKGNWNLHQAKFIAYGALSLGDNNQYDDKKGSKYYLDIVLNGELENQLGINKVIQTGYDLDSGVWAEAPGYAFDVTKNILEIAAVLSNTEYGASLMNDSIFDKAINSQVLQSYPSGQSHGLGDTWYQRVNPFALEMLVAWNAKQDKKDKSDYYANLLLNEISSGQYDRNKSDAILSLLKFVPNLPEGKSTKVDYPQINLVEPLNLIIQRNQSSSNNSDIAASLYGTKGGHMHANGMAIELFGAGNVLLTDPGRGSSYWQKDHNDYYAQMPAHNTVFVHGMKKYSPDETKEIKFNTIYPAINSKDKSNYSYVNASFNLEGIEQNRTVSLIRVDDNTAFFFDVFKSKSESNNITQDWFIHSMSQDLTSNYTFSKSNELSEKTSPAYAFFNDEVSAKMTESFNGVFNAELNGNKVSMKVIIPELNDSELLVVDSPANRAARFYYPESDWNKESKTLIVRKHGQAWNEPFVALYETYEQSKGSKITDVKRINNNEWLVKGDSWQVSLSLKDNKLNVNVEK